MRIKETKVYKFDELTDRAKEKAIEELYDINVDYEWWDSIYDDAEQIGLKINAFDIDRGSYVKGEFIESPEDVAELIVKNHGNKTETFKTANQFLNDVSIIRAKYKDAGEDNWDEQSDIEELEEEFLKSICEDYRIMLQKEYEYFTSEEAIIETIKMNDYEFTEDGKLA